MKIESKSDESVNLQNTEIIETIKTKGEGTIVVWDYLGTLWDLEQYLRKWAKQNNKKIMTFQRDDEGIEIEFRDKYFAANFFCPICKISLVGSGINAKYNHFLKVHPELVFIRTGPPEGHRYACGICSPSILVSAYDGLIKHYRDIHGWKEPPQPC